MGVASILCPSALAAQLRQNNTGSFLFPEDTPQTGAPGAISGSSAEAPEGHRLPELKTGSLPPHTARSSDCRLPQVSSRWVVLRGICKGHRVRVSPPTTPNLQRVSAQRTSSQGLAGASAQISAGIQGANPWERSLT